MAETTPESDPPVNGGGNGKSIKEVTTDLFNTVKTPVFWLAIGYFACKWMDRKKKV